MKSIRISVLTTSIWGAKRCTRPMRNYIFYLFSLWYLWYK